MSGSLTLPQPVSVLMSVTPETIKDHADSGSMGCHLGPHWYMKATLFQESCQFGWPVLPPVAMMISRPKLLPCLGPWSYQVRVSIDVRGLCCHQSSYRFLGSELQPLAKKILPHREQPIPSLWLCKFGISQVCPCLRGHSKSPFLYCSIAHSPPPPLLPPPSSSPYPLPTASSLPSFFVFFIGKRGLSLLTIKTVFTSDLVSWWYFGNLNFGHNNSSQCLG